MRLTREIEGTLHWIEVKNRWAPRDLARWRQVTNDAQQKATAALWADQEARRDDPTLPDQTEEVTDLMLAEDRAGKLALLDEFSTDMHIEDVDGNVYTAIYVGNDREPEPHELTPERMSGLDAAVYVMLTNAASEAYQEASQLGRKGGRRS